MTSYMLWAYIADGTDSGRCRGEGMVDWSVHTRVKRREFPRGGSVPILLNASRAMNTPGQAEGRWRSTSPVVRARKRRSV
jgi:hypothetical protein